MVKNKLHPSDFKDPFQFIGKLIRPDAYRDPLNHI